MPILEDERYFYEDLERLEQACADRILDDPRSHRDRLIRDHQLARFVDRFQQQSTRLLELKRDPARQKEIDALDVPDPFPTFYSQLSKIRDFHRQYPNERVENLERAYRPSNENVQAELIAAVDTMFTGEESHGRFFDLITNHEQFCNLPGAKRVTYLQYLASFDKFDTIAKSSRRGEKYFQYLSGLATYLESYLKRTRPLENPEGLLEKIESEFTEEWDKGTVAGWAKDGETTGAPKPALYCGVCEKVFQNQNVFDHHIPSKKHKKAAAEKGVDPSSTEATDADPAAMGSEKAKLTRLRDRAVAQREFRIQKLAEVLKPQREATLTNVERKASLTDRERQMELEMLYNEAQAPLNASGMNGDDNGDDGSDSDGDEKIYNPLKLPLAWDGKPIPYWLYKLHGLGVEFPCEICGNFVYMGRRAFDKHFNEARHIHGLRCLGITNTTLFREITKIDEAQRLWEKLEKDRKKNRNQAETVEEMEDAMGNVMPKKVFEDLQKQGLL